MAITPDPGIKNIIIKKQSLGKVTENNKTVFTNFAAASPSLWYNKFYLNQLKNRFGVEFTETFLQTISKSSACSIKSIEYCKLA